MPRNLTHEDIQQFNEQKREKDFFDMLKNINTEQEPEIIYSPLDAFLYDLNKPFSDAEIEWAYNSANRKWMQEMKEEKEKNEERNRNRISDPPKEKGSDSQLLNFLKEHFVNITDAYYPGEFENKIEDIMSDNNVDNYELTIDEDRKFRFELNPVNNSVSVDFYLINTKENIKEPILYEKDNEVFGTKKDVVDKLQEIVTELTGDVEKKEMTTNEFMEKEWDTSYMYLPENQRLEAITNLYFELKNTNIFDVAELNELWSALYQNCDINILANPLYDAKIMGWVKSLYLEKSTEEHTQVLENLSRFSAANFSHTFSETEFLLLLESAYSSNLAELTSQPNFSAYFKAMNLFDKSREKNTEIKYNIGENIFVINSVYVVDPLNGDKNIQNSLGLEYEDNDGNKQVKPLYGYNSATDERKGGFDFFIEKFNEKYFSKDVKKIVDNYVTEIRNAIKDDTNRNNEKILKLLNGTQLSLEGIRYTQNESKLFDSNSFATGCAIYLISDNDKQLIYSDDLSKNKKDLNNVYNIVQSAKGIDVKDESVVTNVTPNIKNVKDPEQLIKESIKNCLNKHQSVVIGLNNGETIIVSPASYYKDGKLQDTFRIDLKRDDDSLKPIYCVNNIYVKNQNKIITNGKWTDAVDYYKQVEFNESLDSKIDNYKKEFDNDKLSEKEQLLKDIDDLLK